MTNDVDRFFAAAALQRGLIDESRLKEALAEWSNAGTGRLTEHFKAANSIPPNEIAAFERLLEKIIGQSPRSAPAKIRELAEKAVQHVIDRIDDATVKVFLLGDTQPATSFNRIVVAHTSYRLIEPLAEGGIGRVWSAHDISLDRIVALKELKPNAKANAAARRRFIQEAQITGRLQHPNIVPVYRLGQEQEGQDAFYTMRLLGRNTLEKVIADFHRDRAAGKRDRVAVLKLLNIFVDICNAVAYAHSNGVAHRDLKPSNVMVGDFGEALVVDWGLAKLLTSHHEPQGGPAEPDDDEDWDKTLEGAVIGSPLYMAPEQAAGRTADVGIPTDIYCLGGILYSILTGQAPHRKGKEDSRQVHLASIIRAEPPSASKVVKWAPAALDAIAAKAMANSPADRYASVGDMLDDVRRWMVRQPVSVYREPMPQRLARVAQQHPVMTQATAAACLALVVLTVAVTASFYTAAEILTRNEHKSLQLQANQIHYQLHDTAELMADGARGLTDHNSVTAALVAAAAKDQAGEERAVAQFEEFVIDFLKYRGYYLSFALLDPEQGREIARFERDTLSGQVRRVPRDKLVSRHSEDVVVRALQGGPDKIHYSRAILGETPDPKDEIKTLSISAALPIFDHGKLQGVAVLVRDLTEQFRNTLKPAAKEGIRSYLVNERDEIVLQVSPGSPPLFELGGTRHLTDDYPAASKCFKSAQEHSMIDLSDDSDNEIVTCVKIDYDPLDSNHYLGLMMTEPADDLVTIPEGFTTSVLALLLTVMVGAMIAAFVFSRLLAWVAGGDR